MEYLLLGLIAVGIPFVLPIASWISARRTRARLHALESVVEEQATTIRRLEALVTAARKAAAATAEPSAEAAGVVPPVPLPPATPTIVRPPVDVPTPAAVPRPEPPVAAPPSVAAPPRVSLPPRPAPPAVAHPPAPPPVVPSPAATAQPPRPPVPPVIRPAASPAVTFDWENVVGVKLFSAIAGIALVLAAIFFLRYSIEHGWLQPPIRVAIGIAVAIGLLLACELKAARRYPVTANALDAAAIAILFSTFFAAHALWNLIPALAAFVLLAIVTTLAVLLSIRRESLFIAVLGLLGGFATPALLSSGENKPIPLFGYLLLLNIGLAWVANRQRWHILSVLTLVLTAIYQWGWVLRFLGQTDLTLAMGIFLVFPVASIAGLVLARRARAGHAQDAFERTALVASVMPLAFAAYLAAVPAYGARPWLLFGFLLLVDAGLLAVAIARGEELLHAAGAVATVLVMSAWLSLSYAPGSGVPALACCAAFVVFFSVAPVTASLAGHPFLVAGRSAEYAAPLLLFVPAVLARTEPSFARPLWVFATTLALVLVVAWRAIAEERGGLYFVAAFFAVAVQASWSSSHLTLERLRGAVAAYAVFGAAAIGVPVFARRIGRELEPAEGAGVVLLASLGLLLFLSWGPIAPEALWALALLLAILNGGLFVESAAGGLPMLAAIGSVASWGILAIWWTRAAGAVGILPSLMVLAGLTLATVGGHVWAHLQTRQATHAGGGGTARAFAEGSFLGLGGHLFLLFLVVNRQWSLPPWPWMATLAVVTLALSVASRATRTPALHGAAAVAAAIVIAAWTTSVSAPWLLTAVVASLVASAYALGWISVSADAAASAGVVLFVGEATAIVAAAAATPAPFPSIVVAHVVNLSLILVLAWQRRWRHVAVIAIAPAMFALTAQTGGEGQLAAQWEKLLTLALAIYAVFTAYPLVLARKAGAEREPYVAAVLASALFFFAARAALIAGGYRWGIGALPVAEGGVMAILLRQLLRIEPVGQRDLGRLALVAGATLAFITVAIPLQLERQWITIGWAVEAGALAWLYTRVPHRGLLQAGAALFAVVFVRLALNSEVLSYAPRGTLPILNWYLYAYAVCATAFFMGAWWFSKSGGRDVLLGVSLSRALPGAGVILLFLLLNIEIADFYATGPSIVFRFGVTLSQDLTYTIGWLLFGMTLLGFCIYLRSHAGRIAALALIAVTTFKCFLYDLGSLEGLYRVASFVGLASALALVSLALQKWVLVRPGAQK